MAATNAAHGDTVMMALPYKSGFATSRCACCSQPAQALALNAEKSWVVKTAEVYPPMAKNAPCPSDTWPA